MGFLFPPCGIRNKLAYIFICIKKTTGTLLHFYNTLSRYIIHLNLLIVFLIRADTQDCAQCLIF